VAEFQKRAGATQVTLGRSFELSRFGCDLDELGCQLDDVLGSGR
jgi:hypothetical protein